MKTFLYPPTPVSVSIPPLSFLRNGVSTEVTEDTVTPGNNRPLPVQLTSLAGPVTVNAGDLYIKLEKENDSVEIAAEVHAEDDMNNTVYPVTPGTVQNLRMSEYGMLFTRDIWLEDAVNNANSNLQSMDGKITKGRQLSDDSLAVTLSFDSQNSLAAIESYSQLGYDAQSSISSVLGTIGDAKVVNPDELSATVNSLLRGVLQKLDELEAVTGLLTDNKESDPDAASASLNSLLRGVLDRVGDVAVVDETLLGLTNETAPASDTAASAINGRLQRVAQRITSLITALGAEDSLRQSNPDAATASLNSLVRGTLEELLQINQKLTTANNRTVLTGSVRSAQITVGTSEVRATADGLAPQDPRRRLLIKPHKDNTAPVYLGGTGITTGSGMEIIGPDRIEFLNDSSDYFLISSGANQKVEILEVLA